jgi:Trypsin-co-occurring domain 1
MKKLVEFELEGGGTVVAEVEALDDGSGLERVSRDGGIEKASQTFDAALVKVKATAQKLIGGLSDLLVAPDEIELEFGVKLSAKAGVVIASADSEANFKISLKWKKP